MKFWGKKLIKLNTASLFALFLFATGCIKIKQDRPTARLLKVEDATQTELMNEVNRFARVSSMRARMALKFEDNSFAEFGSKEVYRQADGVVVVQRPGKILLTVQAPIIRSDIAKMTSDGETFRVAILVDSENGKYRKFVKGTNNADYSKLQERLDAIEIGDSKEAKRNVNAFANLRPQHLTDAMLVRPTDDAYIYTQSTIFVDEEDKSVDKKSPLRTVTRGYYLLDEFGKSADGSLKILRRFWFDRVGGIRLARQQLFDDKGEIESDITYGKQGNLTNTGNYTNLPLEILVTRIKERYSMRLAYQTPEDVSIGNVFPDSAFRLENSWNLEELDLDEKLREIAKTPTKPSAAAGHNRFQ